MTSHTSDDAIRFGLVNIGFGGLEIRRVVGPSPDVALLTDGVETASGPALPAFRCVEAAARGPGHADAGANRLPRVQEGALA